MTIIASTVYGPHEFENKDLFEQVTLLEAVHVTKEMFDDIINTPETADILAALDISSEDYEYLFGILDCDNSGELMISETIDGISRLRGQPRRSDIVAVDLMTRSMQQKIDNIEDGVNEILRGRV